MSMESMDFMGPSGSELKQKRLPKKSLYDRVSLANKFKASTIQADEVALLFNPEFLNIPQKTCKIGNKISGSSADEVLEEIMNQMAPAGFPVKKAEQFNQIYHDHVPRDNQETLNDAVVLMNEMLKDIDIDGKESAEQINDFKQAVENIDEYVMDNVDGMAKLMVLFSNQMSFLLQELAGETVCTSPHRASLHKAISLYWLQLLTFSMGIPYVKKDGTMKQCLKRIELRKNGASHFEFQMEVSDAFLRSHCKTDLPPLGPRGDAESSDTQTSHISTKTIVADPDLSAIRRVKNKDISEDTIVERSKIFLVAEFDGPMSGMTDALSKSEKSDSSILLSPTGSLRGDMSEEKDVPSTSKRKSSRLSDGQSKRRKLSETHVNKDEELQTCGIRRQHFLELMCAIKYQLMEYKRGAIKKCYGLYCVKHRFYITCLTVVRKDCKKIEGADELLLETLFANNANTPEMFCDDDLYKFRMVCTDYLDMTNSVHINAALKFIGFLAFCEDYI